MKRINLPRYDYCHAMPRPPHDAPLFAAEGDEATEKKKCLFAFTTILMLRKNQLKVAEVWQILYHVFYIH